MANAWFISEIYGHDELIMCDEIDFDEDPQPIPTNRIQVRRSPYFDVFLGHHTVRLTINSGSTGNMMRASAAIYLNAIVTRSSQSTHQANGSSYFKVIGETRLTFTRDNQKLQFEWLVVEILDSEVLVGIPLMKNNDISIRPSRCQVLIGITVFTNTDCHLLKYSDTPSLEGSTKLSFTNRTALLSTQSEWSDIRRNAVHLRQGTQSQMCGMLKDISMSLQTQRMVC